ncbi:ABC transporter substrate-binding protein [Leucobacter sp. gxy201]|uniref:ABC transporter substrate-binding protein n=1 Tax=Leucobacter sp. gxy201 TaxID=2957200 RepID=UPI003DA1079A
MKKKLLGVAALAALTLGLSACGADPNASPAGGDAQADSGDEIIVGAALCLTGIQSPLDEPILRGVQLKVDEINENGGLLGKQVKLINLDGKSDPVVVGNNGEQLVSQGAEVVITPADFDFGGPASRAAQSAGIVGISPGASSPLYGSKTLGDKQFTLSMWNTTMGAAAAEWAYGEQGYTKAYVVTDQFIDYTTSLSDYFIESFEHQGGEILGHDTYTQGDQDFSAQLQRLKSEGADAEVIFVSSYMPDLGLIIRDIRAAGIDTPILGGDSYDDPELFEVLGAEYGNGVTYASHAFLSEQASELVPAFLDLYKAKHGEAPDTALVANGYDTMTVLAEAIEAAGTTEGAALAKQMTEMEFPLLTGNLSWSSADTGHAPQKEAALMTVAGGEVSFLKWVMPEWVPEP